MGHPGIRALACAVSFCGVSCQEAAAQIVRTLWGPPLAISSGRLGVWNPAIARDGAGDVTAAWVQKTALSVDGFGLATLPIGAKRWMPAITVDDKNGGGYPSRPAIVRTQGRIILAWNYQGTRAAHNRLIAAIVRPGPPLAGTLRILSPLAQNFASHPPAMIRDSEGDTFVAWVQQGRAQSSQTIFAAIQPKGTTDWQGPFRVARPARTISGVTLVSGAKGLVYAIWPQRSRRYVSIKAVILHPDGTRDARAETIMRTPASHSLFHVTSAVGSDGRIVVAWGTYDPRFGRNLIMAARYEEKAASWSPPVIISSRRQGNARHPVAAANMEGTILVAWRQHRAQGGAIDAAFLPSGHRAWRRPEQVVAPRSEKARPGRPALTTDSVGDFIMAWRQFIGGQTRIDASVRQTTTKRWTPPIMVNDPSIGENTALRDIPSLLKKRLIALYGAPAGPRVSNPVLSGGTRGPVIAVWSQGNSQYTAIYASRYR